MNGLPSKESRMASKTFFWHSYGRWRYIHEYDRSAWHPRACETHLRPSVDFHHPDISFPWLFIKRNAKST